MMVGLLMRKTFSLKLGMRDQMLVLTVCVHHGTEGGGTLISDMNQIPHIAVYNVRPCLIPIVCNHSTHVKSVSLLFPKKFGQKRVHYTQQNTVKS